MPTKKMRGKKKSRSGKKYTMKNLLNKLKKLRILGKSRRRKMKGGGG